MLSLQADLLASLGDAWGARRLLEESALRCRDLVRRQPDDLSELDEFEALLGALR